MQLFTEQEIAKASSAAEAGVMWWANALKSPKHDAELEGSSAQIMEILLLHADCMRPTREFEQFREELQMQLQHALTRYGRLAVGVDYHPDQLLDTVATAVGLNLGMTDWPWKTMMWLSNDQVSVRCGYGAATGVVWRQK